MPKRDSDDEAQQCSRGEVEVEVEIEVDENRVGSRWNVTASRNGTPILRRSAVTRGPSGSFELRRVVAPGSPRSRVLAVARQAAPGEVCRITAER